MMRMPNKLQNEADMLISRYSSRPAGIVEAENYEDMVNWIYEHASADLKLYFEYGDWVGDEHQLCDGKGNALKIGPGYWDCIQDWDVNEDGYCVFKGTDRLILNQDGTPIKNPVLDNRVEKLYRYDDYERKHDGAYFQLEIESRIETGFPPLVFSFRENAEVFFLVKNVDDIPYIQKAAEKTIRQGPRLLNFAGEKAQIWIDVFEDIWAKLFQNGEILVEDCDDTMLTIAYRDENELMKAMEESIIENLYLMYDIPEEEMDRLKYMPKEQDLNDAHMYSSNHMLQLKADKVCGCFYCLRIFSPEEIKDWLIAEDDNNECDRGGTAVCPYCGIDSVIGESSGYPITEQFLKSMKKYWFARVSKQK